MSNATLNAALEYAARGWQVFPVESMRAGRCTCGKTNCDSPGKHPRTARGRNDASTDPATIRRMRWAGANVGIATGAGLAVIDVDAKAGATMAPNGNGWNITDADGATFHVPESRVIRTGGGGWHWYGRGAAITRANTLGRGIDTRGDGGYVVAPPSTHVTGGVYAVETDTDLAELPADIAARVAPKAKPGPRVSRAKATPTGGTPYGRKALAAELARLRSAPEGTRNEALNRAAFALGQLAAGGEIEAAAFDELLDAARAIGLGDVEAEKTARSGWNAGAAEPRSAPEKPTAAAHAADAADGSDDREPIEIDPWRRNAVIQRGAELLRDEIFLRDTLPVFAHALGDDLEERGVRHPRGGLVIAAATPAHVSQRLHARLAPYAVTRSGGEPARTRREIPPRWIDGLLGAATLLGAFRQLTGVVRAPLLDPDSGEITTAHGYDRRSGFYLDWRGGDLDVPARPTAADARAALERLMRPWRGYRDRVDEVAIAAAALTAAVRPTLPTAPCIVIDGTVAGCGKGLFARTLAALATGGPPATIDEGSKADELEKRFDAAVISGAPVILLDNVQRRLASSALESGLTEARKDIRILGKLDMISVPWRALVLITANNPSLRRDLLRRALPVRIVAKSDNPEADVYGFDPVAETMRDRRDLLAAAFTVLRATVQRRPATPTLGSFEGWARLVGGACSWLLETSPVELIQTRKADDPDAAAETAIVTALAANWPNGTPFRADEAAKIDVWGDAPGFHRHRDDGPTASAVGYWLRARKDRFFGNLQLKSFGHGKRGTQWQIVAG